MKKILITTGNGMFGKATAAELLQRDAHVRIMVRDRSKCTIHHPNAEIVTGDMDDPASLAAAMDGIASVFLSTPIDTKIAERERNVIEEARKQNVEQIVKIYGAVKHDGDQLVTEHTRALHSLTESGISWTLISPNSVMETSLLSMAASIRFMRAIYGCSGTGKVGLVALKDVAHASAHVLTSTGHSGKNYELTGPESPDMTAVAACFSKVLGKKISYIDLSEERFGKMLQKFDKTMTPERLEIEVLCHLRAWRKGQADMVTTAFHELTGTNPTSLENFITANKDLFSKGMLPLFMSRIMRMMV